MKIKGGIVSIDMEDTLTEMTLDIFRKANPLGEQVFNAAIQEIQRNARANWPVRQPTKIERDDQGEPKRTKDGRVRFRKQTSQRSIDKFVRYARINGNSIEVGLENRAQYAWAIRMGIDTAGEKGKSIILPLRARVSNELMVKPLRQRTNKVVREYTKGLLDRKR